VEAPRLLKAFIGRRQKILKRECFLGRMRAGRERERLGSFPAPLREEDAIDRASLLSSLARLLYPAVSKSVSNSATRMVTGSIQLGFSTSHHKQAERGGVVQSVDSKSRERACGPRSSMGRIGGSVKRIAVFFALFAALAGFAAAQAFASGAPAPFFNGFETDTSGWFAGSGFGSITRVPSGYTNAGGYASGVASAAGAFHARLSSADCVNDFGPGTDCSGPYTFWGTDGSSSVFPAGGYVTQVDIYLDVAWAATHPDVRFDWDSAIQDNTTNCSGGPCFLSDYVFNAGTEPATGVPSFVIGASPNATRSGAYPENPCPNPSAPPNTCRAPAVITTSGWYTFRHSFHDDGTGHLAVDLTILNSSGNTVATWTIYQGFAISAVGGPAYGWFPNEEIPDLAIDNSQLSVLVGPPTSQDQCKKGGWQTFNNPVFKNQGDCVSYVATHGKH
jgi:hypothetical protein